MENNDPNPWPNYEAVPLRTRQALWRYLIYHTPPGGFLTAVAENNLRRAVVQADEENGAALADFVRLFYNEIPADAWGSPERVQVWLSRS